MAPIEKYMSLQATTSYHMLVLYGFFGIFDINVWHISTSCPSQKADTHQKFEKHMPQASRRMVKSDFMEVTLAQG